MRIGLSCDRMREPQWLKSDSCFSTIRRPASADTARWKSRSLSGFGCLFTGRPPHSAGRLTGQRDPPVVLRMPIHPRPPKFYINQRTCTLSRTQAKRRGRCRRHPSSLLQMQGQEPLACTWTPSSLPATVALARAAARKTSPYVSSSASHTSLAGSRDARASNRLPSAWTQARCSL